MKKDGNNNEIISPTKPGNQTAIPISDTVCNQCTTISGSQQPRMQAQHRPYLAIPSYLPTSPRIQNIAGIFYSGLAKPQGNRLRELTLPPPALFWDFLFLTFINEKENATIGNQLFLRDRNASSVEPCLFLWLRRKQFYCIITNSLFYVLCNAMLRKKEAEQKETEG